MLRCTSSWSMRRLMLGVVMLTGCGRVAFDHLSDASGATQDGAPFDASATVYGDFTDLAAWSTFDLTTINPGASGYTGAAFDGRYTYLVPAYNGALHGIVARNDSQGSFSDATSWATFDTSTLNPQARGYDGAAFDGRYIYFVPHQNLAGLDGVVARYDVQQPFSAPTAWTTFDTATLSPNARGFYGARFDGRYLYLVPYVSAVIVRYDTQAAFTSSSAWTTFDLTVVSANAPAFVGAAFDGRYLYLAPFASSTAASGLLVRYDTQASFVATASWSTFDTSAIAPADKGFCGAAFDGRYVYLVPFASGSAVTRYDTQMTFTATSSWETFDTVTVNPNANGLFGATFDGRFVYFAPYGGVAAARYDTQLPFGNGVAWTTLDMTTVDPRASAFYGAAFDGAAVYLVPHGGSTVARFAAKAPPSMPALPGFFGSFL
jgi:hypothetical protein